MTTAKSSFSMARFLPVYKNLLRRNRGSALFYGALGFLFFSLQYLLSYLEYLRYPPYAEGALRSFELIGPANIYNGFAVVFFTGMTLMVPVVIATNLFGYMQSKRSVDVYHALPLTRSELYLATSAAGMTLIWVPMALNFLLVAGCALIVGGQPMGMILLELLCWMVVTFVIFALTAFAAVNVGTTFDTAIFSMGLNASLSAVYVTVMMIASAFLYGFSDMDVTVEVAYRLSPVSLMIGRQMLNGPNAAKMLMENNIAIALWLLGGIAVFVIGLLVYKRRRSEQAESVGNLGPLQMFIRSVATLVGGAMLGAIFCGVFGFETSKPIFLAALSVGALITYFIGDVILTRTVRSIPRALPAALATTFIVCLLAGSVMYGGFGYEKRVPAADSVASVTLQNYDARYSYEPRLDDLYLRDYTFDDAESVALLVQAHAAQVQGHFSGNTADDKGSYNNSLRLTYTLKNGNTLSRRYYGLYPDVQRALLALESNPELLRQTHAAFKGSADMMTSVTVVNALGSDSKTLNLTNDQKQQLLEAVRTDLLNQSPEELENGAQALGYLKMEYRYMRQKSGARAVQYTGGMTVAVEESVANGDQDYSVSTSELLLTESYQNTRALLEQFGAAEQLKNDFSPIEKAYVGVIGYRYSTRGTIVNQTSLDWLPEINDMLYHAYYDKAYYTEQDPGEKSRSFIEIDGAQLSALQSKLSNIYPNIDVPYVLVAIAGEQNGEETITSYYYLPLEALPEQMKYEVCERALEEYGLGYLTNRGYTYFR